MKSLQIKIYGRVQRVGFRYHTLNLANELGVKGFVTNETDGSVLIEAQGEDFGMDLFLKWCNNGPRWSKVEKVDIKPIPINDYDNFIIK